MQQAATILWHTWLEMEGVYEHLASYDRTVVKTHNLPVSCSSEDLYTHAPPVNDTGRHPQRRLQSVPTSLLHDQRHKGGCGRGILQLTVAVVVDVCLCKGRSAQVNHITCTRSSICKKCAAPIVWPGLRCLPLVAPQLDTLMLHHCCLVGDVKGLLSWQMPSAQPCAQLGWLASLHSACAVYPAPPAVMRQHQQQQLKACQQSWRKQVMREQCIVYHIIQHKHS